jgi:threonine/homoserine/homoserine lactone efflux protein
VEVRTSWSFLSNITNPKVLVFYLAVLPQFLVPASPGCSR